VVGLGAGVGFEGAGLAGAGEALGDGCDGPGVCGCAVPRFPTGGRFNGGASSPVGSLPQEANTKITGTESPSRHRILGDEDNTQVKPQGLKMAPALVALTLTSYTIASRRT
jgi:hypothetical protein